MWDTGSGLVRSTIAKARQSVTHAAVKTASDTLNRTASGVARAAVGSMNKVIPDAAKGVLGKTGDIAQSALDGFLETTGSNMQGPKTRELSPRISSQFPEITDVLSPSSDKYMEINTNKMANVIGKDQLLQIVGLPPISDNVVDPPPVWDASELNGGQATWGSGNLVGQEYVERVLMRGQFLVLVPLEFKPNFSKALLHSVGWSSDRSSPIADAFDNVSTNFETFLDRIDSRLNVASYGFTAVINHYRYWISVGAHMKVVLHTLGIDPLDTTVTASSYGAEYHAFLKDRLPDFMVDRVFSHGNWKGINALLGGGGNDNDVAEELKQDANSKLNELKQDVANTLKSDRTITGFKEKAKGLADKFSKTEVGSFIKNTGEKISSKLGEYNFTGKNGNGEEDNDMHTTLLQDVPITLYNTSYANILNAVTNIDIRNNTLMNLPFITFYCNGNIDRNLQFSLEADKSSTAEATTDVVARTLPNLIRGIGEAAAAIGGKKGETIAAVANATSGALDSTSDIMREIAYHSDDNITSTFITNTYIPKTMRGGSTSVSYNVPLRFVAAGSDKFSIAQMFWGLCLLLPFVVQVSKPRMPMIIPQAAMYCGAFSKGVMNVPRGYISSMSISTDPAFQTTNGIPLELNISLTIESLYTLTTMPNFTETYGGGSDLNLITAMWHPMSSFNVVATLTGTNTVLNHVPSNIFKYFIERPVADAFVSFKTIFQKSGGYFGTQFKQWRIQFDSGDNYQYV